MDRSTTYPEVKTILKDKQHSKWRHKHPRYHKADPYYLLTRREQVTVFRLRTQPPQLSPIFQTPHWPYRAVPLRYWQSDNRTSTAVLPHLRATQKGNLARPHRQQNIYCSPAPSTGHSERESGQTTQTTEHLLQSCPIYEPLRKGIWPDHTDNRTSTAVLPHLRATLKGNLARPHRQQNIYCSPAPSTSHSERESGQTTQTTEHLLQSCPIYEPL